jgi:transposase
MKNYIAEEDHIMFDGTNLVSHSKKMEGAKIGYNSKQNYDPQFNILFLFSSELKAPVFYRLLPGNMREVKAFKLTIQEAGI